MQSSQSIRQVGILALAALAALLSLIPQPTTPVRAQAGQAAPAVAERQLPSGGQTGAHTIYLPLVQQAGTAPGGSPDGTLVDGGAFQGVGGALVGVVDGTLAQPIQVALTPTPPPAVTLPSGITPTGDFYLLGAQALVITPPDKPLLVGLPVPAGADPQQLAVAALVPGGYASEESGQASGWTTLRGSYDAATNLYVVTMRVFVPEGITLVLFSHPDNEPLAATAPAPQQSAPVRYAISCDPLHGVGACFSGTKNLLASELESAHQVFVDSFGFKPPALNSYIGAFTGSNNKPMLQLTYHNVMLGTLPCTDAQGKPILGQYSFATMELLVCMELSATGDAIRATVRHELFHAIQAAYPNVAADVLSTASNPSTHWQLEGTATMAEKSSYLLVRSADFKLRQVTESLLSTDEVYEYEAQDFWIYTGDELDAEIDYLQAIFEQGATPEHVGNALNLPDAYWSWVKNQAIEHQETMFGSFQAPACTLDSATYDGTQMEFIFYPTSRTASGTLPPLTAALVEVNFQRQVGYAAIAASAAGDDADLRYKVYEDGEAGCEAVPDGNRVVTAGAPGGPALQEVLPAGSRRYVLLANTSSTKTISYAVAVVAE